MSHLHKVQRFNYVFLRITWVFLSIGLVDHFSCEWEATAFACEFLPHDIARSNLTFLWIMIAVVVIGEFVAWILKRRETRYSDPSN